ncbi:MAG: aminodeoxychorismate lyase [Planctomycetes bacterium]|nr:aminodeoxychorismate lyase [Planctomycetota bacterium]
MGTESPDAPDKRAASLHVFFNGDMVLEEEALVSVRDRGFLYGDGVFETLRSYNGRPFLIEDHLQRLASSAQVLGIPLRYGLEGLRSAVENLLRLNRLTDALIRVTLSRGESPHYGLQPPETPQPTLIIQTHPFRPHPEESYRQGVRLAISAYRRSTTCPLARHKTANFLAGIMARQEAARRWHSTQGVQDALFLNTEGQVCEATVSNIFMVESGRVVTPSLQANILPGITRKKVLEICQGEGITASEELFGTERLFQANEVFLTNSLMEIMPVSCIEDKRVSKTIPGKITNRLMEAYKGLTTVDSRQGKTVFSVCCMLSTGFYYQFLPS